MLKSNIQQARRTASIDLAPIKLHDSQLKDANLEFDNRKAIIDRLETNYSKGNIVNFKHNTLQLQKKLSDCEKNEENSKVKHEVCLPKITKVIIIY